MPLITETYYLSLTQDNRGILRLRCSQDDTLRTVNLKLYNNGSIFAIPSGISASVSGVKQNGAVFSKPCTISQDRESVVLQLSSDITNVDGIIVAEIVLNDGEGGRLGTSNFIIQVEKNPIRAGVIQDTETPIEYINDFIEKIQTLTARLNNLITPSGDPSLAEVVDARIGILDSTTYQTLGARLNAEFQRLSNALNGVTILESTGDTTDRTSEILSKLNAYGTCKLGKGDFYVNSLIMPEGSHLVGSGNLTRVILSSSVTDGYIVKPRSNCIIENISFYGGFTGTYSELIASGSSAQRHCIILDRFDSVNSENIILSNIFINNFVGSAIIQRYTVGCHCKNVIINMCYAGIDISNASYDGQFTNVSLEDTRFGIVQNGSNFIFTNCVSKDSAYHIMSDQQNTGCTFSSCSFSESSLETTSKLASISNAREGVTFDNCLFDSSLSMLLNACDGIVIKGTNFVGSDTFTITVSNGRNTLLLITDCIADVEPVVTNAGTAARITSCYLKDGTAWSISEADIIVDGELSDESENPVQNKVINRAIGEIKADLKEHNSFDYLQKATRASTTHNGVTYTWSGKTCKLVGTSTDISSNVLVAQASRFSGDFTDIAGKTLIVYYSGVVSSLNVRFYKDGNKTIILDKYVRGVQMIDVPSDAEGIVIRLFLSAEKSIDETVNMCVCSSGTIDIVEDVLHPIKFNSVIASADLNDQPIQTIAVDRGSGTLHSPHPNSAAYVFTFGTTSLSRIQYWVSYINGKTFYRRYMSGTWYDWIEMKNGDTYENTYTTEYYENTYNIECTPTITSDTNNYLASTGDTTDRTGDIQTMLNTTGVCRLGPGVFYVTGVEVPNYGALIGSGKKTQLILASSVTSGYAVKLKTYSTVKDLYILGSVSAITPSGTVGNRHGIVFEGTADSQSSPQTFYRSYITGCLIRNFAGGGITCRNTGLSPSASLVVSDCQIATCDVGVNVSYFSEFHRWTNVTAQECYYGCICNGGNNNFANCDFSMNKQALLIDNSTGQSRNNTHGTFSACTFHHSANAYSGGAIVSVGTCMQILGATAGEIFTGCQIGYGNIEIDDSVGIRFDSCNFLRMTALEITDSPLVVFSDCNFFDANSSPLTQSGNKTLKFHDCYLRDGTVFDPMA